MLDVITIQPTNRSLRTTHVKGFSIRTTILCMNKTQKYLRYRVQIYCGCSASITFYEWNSISVIWPLDVCILSDRISKIRFDSPYLLDRIFSIRSAVRRMSNIHTLYSCILILYRHSRKNLLFLVFCTI